MEKKWFVGIDVSKKTLDCAILRLGGKEKEAVCFQVQNDETGFMDIRSGIRSRKIEKNQLVVVMENTGMYCFELCCFLEATGIDYCVLNPLHVKLSFGLVRGKNDKLDSVRLASYARLHREELKYTHLSSRVIIHLKELIAERKHYTNALAALKNFDQEPKPKECLLTNERVREAKTFWEEKIQAVEKEMLELVCQEPDLLENYNLLVSIKGIALVNAINTIVYTNNFTLFTNARKYACYIGIAPFEYTSGTSVKGRTRVCKAGAKSLKADLSMAARSAVAYDNDIKTYYQRKKDEGKHFGVVLNAVKFKLVERMFAVVKRRKPYVDIYKYKSQIARDQAQLAI